MNPETIGERITRAARQLGPAPAVLLVAALSITDTASARELQQQEPVCCPIVELRQYTLFPGKRDTLISLFDDKFIEGQEDVGIRVAGQFRDLNDANRFVWIRGFENMDARKKALGDFYYGPVWQAHRDQANATLEDNDNVLLLRPAAQHSGFALDRWPRPGKGQDAVRSKFIVATIYYFEQEASSEFIAFFEHTLLPLFHRNGAHVLARYVSEKSVNTFERLPVREKDNVFVWFAAFENRQSYERYLAKLAQDGEWRNRVSALIDARLQRPAETLLLEPTARSLIR